MKNILLQTEYIIRDDPPATYTLRDGTKVTIGIGNTDFFGKLVNLPASAKIQLMQLTTTEMEHYIKEENRILKKQMIETIDKEWYWRETGEPVENTVTIPGIGYIAAIKARIYQGKKFTTSDLKTIIAFFTGDRSEVYLKEYQS